MTAIFTGLGAGLVRSSAATLGGAGVLGSASLGRGGEGISVNAATGNLVVSQQDEFLTGRGLDVAVGRTYNSLAETSDRDNNDKWQMSTVRRVLGLTGTLNTAGSTVQRLSGDGSLVTYTYSTRLVNGSNVSAYWATAGDGAHEKLVKSGSNWVWTDGASQVTETYSEFVAGSGEFRIVNQLDTDGYGLSYSYKAGTDLLDKVTTANGEWVQYVWSTTSPTQITQLLTGTGATTQTRTRYGYDGQGRLHTVPVDYSAADNSTAGGQYYATYNTYGTNGLLATVTQSDGSRIDISYDASGRVIYLSQSVSASESRNTTIPYGTNFTTILAPDGQTTRLDYDPNKQLTKITAPPAVAGAAAQVVQYVYDTDGNLTKVIGADLKETNYTYDAQGNVDTATDANTNSVKRWYDSGNRVTAMRSYGANGVEYARYA